MVNTHTVFDADWYLARNPDVEAAVSAGLMSAQEHYERFGMAEDRAPGPLFDPKYYLAANRDVAEAVEAGLLSAAEHFLQFGAAENRSPLPVFDSEFYLSRNPDIAPAVEAGLLNAVEHFLLHGHAEARALNPFVNLSAYLDANEDVAALYAKGQLSPLLHLLNHGLTEARQLGNGIDLEVFAEDSIFQDAVGSGDVAAAIARVQEVAPFLPTFVPPVGWAPAADTPIPLDFVPPAGTKLIVPPSVVVPSGMVLPSYFEIPSSDDNEWRPTTFEVRESAEGVYSFHGTAKGNITISVNEEGSVSFSRQGITAETSVELSEWGPGSNFITLGKGQTLVLSPEDTFYFAAASLYTGTPAFTFTGNGSVQIDTRELQFEGDPIWLPELADEILDDYPTELTAMAGVALESHEGPVGGLLYLLNISPTLKLEFAGEGDVTVAEEVLLVMHPEHADGISIVGDGSTLLLNEAVLQLLSTLSSVDLDGLTLDRIGTSRPSKGVDLDIGTEGLNLITATPGDDIIDVDAGMVSFVYAGQGRDQVTLKAAEHTAIVIGVGSDAITADSNMDEMDVITGFTLHKDLILSLPLYFSDGAALVAPGALSIDSAEDSDITVEHGIAIFSDSFAKTQTLESILETLSEYMEDTPQLVAFEYEGSTYLMHGDGKSGLTNSDMVVELVDLDLTGVTHVAEIAPFASV